MTQRERTGRRWLTYSAFHRPPSLARWIPFGRARMLTMQDIDSVEYDHISKKPLLLVETALDCHVARDKELRPLKRLAEAAHVPAVYLLYDVSSMMNPTYTAAEDVAAFRARILWPDEDSDFRRISCEQWSKALMALHSGGYDAFRLALGGTQ